MKELILGFINWVDWKTVAYSIGSMGILAVFFGFTWIFILLLAIKGE